MMLLEKQIDEGNTMTVKQPVLGKGPQPLEKPKTKVSIGL